MTQEPPHNLRTTARLPFMPPDPHTWTASRTAWCRPRAGRREQVLPGPAALLGQHPGPTGRHRGEHMLAVGELLGKPLRLALARAAWASPPG